MMRQGCNCWRRIHNRPIGRQMTTGSRVLLVMSRTTSYPLCEDDDDDDDDDDIFISLIYDIGF